MTDLHYVPLSLVLLAMGLCGCKAETRPRQDVSPASLSQSAEDDADERVADGDTAPEVGLAASLSHAPDAEASAPEDPARAKPGLPPLAASLPRKPFSPDDLAQMIGRGAAPEAGATADTNWTHTLVIGAPELRTPDQQAGEQPARPDGRMTRLAFPARDRQGNPHEGGLVVDLSQDTVVGLEAGISYWKSPDDFRMYGVVELGKYEPRYPVIYEVNGRLVRLSAGGTGEVWLDLDDLHGLDVSLVEAGSLIAWAAEINLDYDPETPEPSILIRTAPSGDAPILATWGYDPEGAALPDGLLRNKAGQPYPDGPLRGGQLNLSGAGEVRGDWVRVQASYDLEPCGDDEVDDVYAAEGWVRWRNQDGRHKVSFVTSQSC